MPLDLVPLFFLLATLVVLAKASQSAIKYATKIAQLAGISEMAVGFLLVAVSTSLPELFVSATSALAGVGELAVGNVIGANISNCALVLGAAAVAGSVSYSKREAKELGLILLAVAALTILLVFTGIGAVSGALLLACFAGYAYWALSFRREPPQTATTQGRKKASQAFRTIGPPTAEFFKPLLFFGISVAVIVACSQFAVATAVSFAKASGITLALVGATIVSIGTTLPELSVSLVAARAGKNGLAIGNAVGSCATNITLIMGTAGVLGAKTISLQPQATIIGFSLATYLLLAAFFVFGKRLSQAKGVALLCFYGLFLFWQSGLAGLPR